MKAIILAAILVISVNIVCGKGDSSEMETILNGDENNFYI